MESPSHNKGYLLYLANFARQCVKIMVTAWLVVGATLLLIIFIEIGCALIYKVSSGNKDANYFGKVESYKGAPWLEEYSKEFIASYDTRWKSYVYYRRKPFKGNYINIDERGVRLTSPSSITAAEAAKTVKIFMFGGSTLWGWGARDQGTISSHLGRALAAQKIKAEITNYAEVGYVNTQELIELILQLQRGNVPDLAIFYDGVNDVYAAYQSGVAGIPQNEWKRNLEYNISSRYNQLRRVFLLNLMDRFYLGRKLKEITGEFQREIKKPANIEGLEKEITTVYLNNIKIIEALSKAYGFTAIYYWQPVIYNKKNLSQREEKYIYDDVMKSLYYNTYTIIKNNSSEFSRYHFFDISDIFAESKEPLYIDYCHVDEDGNKVIGERMAMDLLKIIKSDNRSSPK